MVDVKTELNLLKIYRSISEVFPTLISPQNLIFIFIAIPYSFMMNLDYI
jgi:hypothetical protein